MSETCNAYFYPALPDGVIEGQLFGPRLNALVGYLKGNLGASYTEIQQYCKDVLRISVSRGLICKVVQRVSAALKVPYEELEEAIPYQKNLNIDETGWKENGTKYWVWNARIMTVIETARKQNRSPSTIITEAVNAYHFQHKYPTLLAD